MTRKITISEGLPENRHIQAAIGYLSLWAYSRYDTVRIYPTNNQGDLQAEYSDSEYDQIYVIGAIHHDSGYSFHS